MIHTNKIIYKSLRSSVKEVGTLAKITSRSDLEKLVAIFSSANAVIVAENITEEDRQTINSSLKTDNIRSPLEILGSEFQYVLAWKPFSNDEVLKDLHKDLNKSQDPAHFEKVLLIEEINRLNSFLVTLSRAQEGFFCFEPQYSKFNKIFDKFFPDLKELGKYPLFQPTEPLVIKEARDLLQNSHPSEQQTLAKQVKRLLLEGQKMKRNK